MANKVTGNPSSLHCGPEIQQMKLYNKINERNRLKIPTDRRQTSWLYTKCNKNWVLSNELIKVELPP